MQADNVTKRIYVITDANFQTYQGDGLAVHAWYTDNSGDLYNQGNTNEKMATFEGFNPSGAKGIWFKDITFDNAKTIKFFVYKYGDTGWHSSDATQKELDSNSAMNYYSWNSDNNGALTEEGTVTLYAYLFDGTSTWTQQPLTTTDNVNYTTTIDNQTSFNEKLELIIAPSLAFLEDFSSYKWHMMYRPYSENQEVKFNNQINYGGGCYGGNNTNSLKLNAKASYSLTFKPFDWKYSLAPSFTRTISAVKSNGAYYATFSSDYTVGIPSDVTAFYAGSQSVTGTVSMTSFSNGIPAGEGAFLELKAASNDLTFTPPTSSVDVISGNMLKPTGSYSYDDTKNRYVFAKQGNNVGFFKITEDNYHPAEGKAYLEIPGNDAAPSLSIELDGETTGIKVINIDSENNQNNNQMYDLQGRRIAEPTKGVYIVNGKKVIIK